MRKSILAAMFAATAWLCGWQASDRARASDEIVVAHFGDSNTDTQGPEDQKVNAILEKYLKKIYPQQGVKCLNFGKGGDYIQEFMDKGRYQKVHASCPKIDIACIRYGQNDMKNYSADEFEKRLKGMVEQLNKDYPGIHIILETGIYIDSKHWVDQTKDTGKRSANYKYQVFWDVTRKVAKELNLPLADQWQRFDVETEAGIWDLRWLNPEHKDDPKHPEHYYNAHANYLGVELYALELLRHLRHDYPTALPKAGEKGTDPAANPTPEPKAWSMADIEALRALAAAPDGNAAETAKKADDLLGVADKNGKNQKSEKAGNNGK